MPALRLITLSLFACLLIACGGDTRGKIRASDDPVLAEGERCPSLAGRYFDASEPISWMLAKRLVGYDADSVDWDYFELAGSADTALSVTVAYVDGTRDSARLRKGNAYDGDYYCEDGWLQIGDRNFPHRWDDEVKLDGFTPRRRRMRIAPTADRSLVARLDFINFDQLDVWCGDGCRGFPIPWTFKTRSLWSRADAWEPDGPRPRATANMSEDERRRGARRGAENDRLYLEEQALENGTTEPRAAVARTHARTP